MFLTTRSALAVIVGLLLAPSPASSAATAADGVVVSLDPTVSFVGGTATDRQTVTDAVGRYTSHGLALPDLEVRIHDDPSGCDGNRGLFHHDGSGEAPSGPAIDLCFPGEFLVLHELGHAWEHFNIDDDSRHRFQALAGAPTWNASDVPHSRRAIEIAADALAQGLLPVAITPAQLGDRGFELFAALTGSSAPRLALLDDQPDEPALTAEHADRAAAYVAWRRATQAGDR